MDTITQQPLTAPPFARSVFSYAGFWKRFVAYLIDAIIVGIMELIIIIPFLGMLGLGIFMSSDMEEPSPEFLIAIITTYLGTMLLTVVAGWLYYAILETTKQATLGKMILGIKVTDLQGNKISFGRASGRYFAKILSSLILGIGYIMAGFTQQKQALHDIIAGCLVINK